jgi:hypothetical protein
MGHAANRLFNHALKLFRSVANSAQSFAHGAGGAARAHCCSIAISRFLRSSSLNPGSEVSFIDDGGNDCVVLQLCKSDIKIKKKAIAATSYPIRLQFRDVGNLSRSIRRCDYGVVNRLVDDEGQVVACRISPRLIQ